MEDKLKGNGSENSFHYPNQYETMSVETAFGFLDLARDGHDLLFQPDNYIGFKSLLVLKCGVDIDYVFSDSFKEDVNEVKLHMSNSKLTPEELAAEVEKRIKVVTQQKQAVSKTEEKPNKVSAKDKILMSIFRKKQNNVAIEDKGVEEIEDSYEVSARKR